MGYEGKQQQEHIWYRTETWQQHLHTLELEAKWVNSSLLAREVGKWSSQLSAALCQLAQPCAGNPPQLGLWQRLPQHPHNKHCFGWTKCNSFFLQSKFGLQMWSTVKYLSFPKQVLLETSLSLKKKPGLSTIVRSNYEEAIHTFHMSQNKFSHLLFQAETEPSENSVRNTASRMLWEHRKFKINSVTDQMKELVHLGDLFVQLLWQVPPRGCSVQGPRGLWNVAWGWCAVPSTSLMRRQVREESGGWIHPQHPADGHQQVVWSTEGGGCVMIFTWGSSVLARSLVLLLLLLLLVPCPGSGCRVNQTQHLSCSEQLLLPAFKTISEKIGFVDLEGKSSTCSPL